ncbi:MAG: DUF3987 domain-containing protein [Bacteroidales bacterium]|nr:DUF3987 domain-containing protein [Bacteroidales bacterium]
MSKKTFRPKDWLDKAKTSEANQPHLQKTTAKGSNDLENQVEDIIQRIELSSVDIAPTYDEWRDLGFALADAFDENGRSFYQRLSRFYPNYAAAETDKQFDKCLKAHGHGVTIKTLFHLAKQAGIDVRCSTNNVSTYNDRTKTSKANNSQTPTVDMEEVEEMPTFSQEVQHLLPDWLAQIISKAQSPEDGDLLLLGSLTVISACLPNIYGNYAGREVFPNLFLFVTAQASAGKGRLTLCRHLVQPIHDSLKQLYAAEMEEYKRLQNEHVIDKKNTPQPQEPPIRTLLIPANSSATSVYQMLYDNKGVGLMFETEGDTLANTFKSDYGNFSDGFRKAFHHEMISYTRRKDREFVELPKPRLSALLSGTPRQIQSLIPDTENGLFSRFIFYYMNVRLEWNDVFADSEETLDTFFIQSGYQFFELYKALQSCQLMRFALTDNQRQEFNAFFAEVQQDYADMFGLDIVASVRRLGLITFRIAMVLSALRIMEGNEIAHLLFCEDTDFQIALTMAKVLLQHTSKVYQTLIVGGAASSAGDRMSNKEKLFNALPPNFNRQTYLSAARTLNIPDRTAEKMVDSLLKDDLIRRVSHGNYIKA